MEKKVTEIKLIDLDTALTVLFVALKLCGVIDWSWWWVTLPLWWSIALMIGFIMLGCVIFLITLITTITVKELKKIF